MALAWHSMQFASQAVILSGLFREREKERARIQKVKFMYFLTETLLDWGIRWIETYAALCCASKSWAEVQSCACAATSSTTLNAITVKITAPDTDVAFQRKAIIASGANRSRGAS